MKNVIFGSLFVIATILSGYVLLRLFDPIMAASIFLAAIICLLLFARFLFYLMNDWGQTRIQTWRQSRGQGSASTLDRGAMAFHSKDYQEAVKELLPRAESGEAAAQFMLGAIFSNRDDKFQNQMAAVSWYRKAARQGYTDAQYAIGTCYYRGAGVTPSFEKARLALEHAAEQDHPEAQFMLGVIYAKGQETAVDFTKAYDYFLASATAGDPDAQRYLADLYYHGLGVGQDRRQAMVWTKRAARQGNPVSAHNLGVAYQVGEEVWKNPLLASIWFRRSQESPSLKSEDLERELQGKKPLRISFQRKAPKLDFNTLKKLAEKGKVDAQYELGQLYYSGRGIQKNKKMAHRWWFVAAEQGHAEAERSLAALKRAYPALGPVQVEKAG